MLVAFSPSDAAYLALAVFLLAVGLGLGYALLRLGETFGRLSAFIRGTERELLPVISKVGGSVDRVNAQLDKLDQATDSAVDAVEPSTRLSARSASPSRRPVQKLAGLASGLSHGFATLRTRRSWATPSSAGKEAVAPAAGRPRGGTAARAH